MKSEEVKKIKIPQPYASMVMCGAIQLIKSEWDKINPDDKIFVYATEMSEDFENGYNLYYPLHQKLYNELFFGNISNDGFETNVYLGYVSPSFTGEICGNSNNFEGKYLFVSDPFLIKNPITLFDINSDILLSQKFSRFNKKKIKFIKRKCYNYETDSNGKKRLISVEEKQKILVPIGRIAYEHLSQEREFLHPWVFTEGYMCDLIPSIWDLDEESELQNIIFKYENKYLYGTSSSGLSRCFRVIDKDILINYIDFDLLDIGKDNTTATNLNRYNENIVEAFQLLFDKDFLNNVSEKKERDKDFVRLIYTPMGGQPGWKRKK